MGAGNGKVNGREGLIRQIGRPEARLQLTYPHP